MSRRSLKAQIVKYGAVSLLAAALSILAAYSLNRYLSLRQSVDFEGHRLAAQAQKQAEQLLPGLLLPEEYGSIDLQLNKIREAEDLLSATFIAAPDASLAELLRCPRLSDRTTACAGYWRNQVLTATEVGLPGEVLGYLVKHKRLAGLRQDGIVRLSLAALFCAIALVFLGLIASILVFIERHVRKPVLNLKESLRPVLDGDSTAELSPFSVAELQSLAVQVEQLVRGYEEKRAAAATGELAAQVAHDIRSPLALLNAVARRAVGLSPEDQELLALACERINGIASGLLERAHGRLPRQPRQGRAALALHVLERIVAEKRATHRDREASLSLSVEPEAAASFLAVDPTELGRAVSNLIENAVEAAEGGRARIAVALSLPEKGLTAPGVSGAGVPPPTEIGRGLASIAVRDQGRGIPAALLGRLGQKGVTAGKPGGHGLGLYHARALAEGAGGSLSLESAPGQGARVELTFRLAEPPAWFAADMRLGGRDPVVAVDDDPTIHALWARLYGERLRRTFLRLDPAVLLELSNPATLFLIDNQLEASGPTGMDFIEANPRLAPRSVLVTQEGDSPALQSRCEGVGCRLLPKSLLPYLEGLPARKAHSCDLALIDDDVLTRTAWSMRAREANLRLAAFKSLDELRRARVSPKTPIYIDYLLEGTTGLRVAEILNGEGYEHLVITTGADRLPELPPYIKAVQGKEFPAV